MMVEDKLLKCRTEHANTQILICWVIVLDEITALWQLSGDPFCKRRKNFEIVCSRSSTLFWPLFAASNYARTWCKLGNVFVMWRREMHVGWTVNSDSRSMKGWLAPRWRGRPDLPAVEKTSILIFQVVREWTWYLCIGIESVSTAFVWTGNGGFGWERNWGIMDDDGPFFEGAFIWIHMVRSAAKG